MKKHFSHPSATGGILLVVLVLWFGCAPSTLQNRARRFIRVENENQSRVRAYVASETSPNMRVYIGMVEAHETEEFPLPSVFGGNQGLVVYCEKGHSNGYIVTGEHFQTSFISLPVFSTLVLTIRDPIRYSDYRVYSPE